ncbi:chitin deacetylase 7-like isoform X3 [Penaeus japonicus]|uniref:chitin deacetylase 7-like isoform X3 n=1 Tax=Penaeus japonicus TaxID=27405 RepID=UPI001C712EB2|nr:chitin deacetylase 7-like isoform X3 [Penaeus japonicus]
MKTFSLSVLLLVGTWGALALAASTQVPEATTEAGPEECIQGENQNSPDCLCGSVHNPGNFELSQVPQFVVLSFDDAVTVSNFPFYEEFKNLLNPNNCRITMTFFVSHTYTNYIINELHRLGHEIALHSVSHKSDVQNYWRPANKSVWVSEMSDLKKIIVQNANIPEEDIKGWRAPFLEVGGDEMFSALHDLGLQYDCSWPTLKYTNWYGSKPLGALWPYTLDYPSIQDCQLGRCPADTYKGLWVAPMIDLNDNLGEACAMLDTCRSIDDELLNNADAIEYFLKRNFDLNYRGNRAPFGLYAHHAWFYENVIGETTARKDGYLKFLQYLATKPDVYVVSMNRVLEWMKNPVPVSQLNSQEAFQCPSFDPASTCPDKNNYEFDKTNNLPENLDSVRMGSCHRPKPAYFPWLHNPYGNETIA